MSGIEKQTSLTPEQAHHLIEAFKDSPGMQRLWKLFEEAPPPWPKVHDVPQSTP